MQFFRRFELILFMAQSKLKSESTRTYFSFFWWIIEPVMLMLVYFVVFGVILGRAEPDYIPFLLTGIVVWNWFSNTVMHSADSISGNAGLVTRVPIDKWIFPLVIVVMDTIKQVLVFAVLIVFLTLVGFELSINFLYLPFVMFVQVILILSCSFVVAAITPYIVELKFFLGTGLRVAMYLSGIIYSIERVPESIRGYFEVNPMLQLAESYRNILMYQKPPELESLLYVLLGSLIFLAIGLKLMSYFSQDYPRALLER